MFSFLYHCQDFCQTCLFIWITQRVSYNKQELLTLREHLSFVVYLCCTIMCLTFCIPCYDVCYGFHMDTMFGSSLPSVVCRRDHVMFTLFVLACMWWCPARVMLCICFVFLCLVYPVLPVYLDCPFLIFLRCSLTFIFFYFGYLYSQPSSPWQHCLSVDWNKQYMSIVYRESLTSSECSNGMTYSFMYTHIINWWPDGDFIRLNKGKITTLKYSLRKKWNMFLLILL